MKALVSIHGPNGDLAGSGVVVAQDLILTCAHVINNALGRRLEEPARPDAQFIYGIRFAGAPESLLNAVIDSALDAWSSPPAQRAKGADLCILRLSSRELPEGVNCARIRPFSFVNKFRVWASGYPEDWNERMSQPQLDVASCDVLAVAGNLWLLRATPELQIAAAAAKKRVGGLIYRGFSGGPVADDNGDVIGLVARVRSDPGAATAYLIPAANLPQRIIDANARWHVSPSDRLFSDTDLHLLNEGRLFKLPFTLGANLITCDGVHGARFGVWAPNARAVSVIGDFNGWDPRRHQMRLNYSAGLWELFIPGLSEGVKYKFSIIAAAGTRLPDKADPLARATEPIPGTASIIAAHVPYQWHDEKWMAERGWRQAPAAPMTIYEVHAASWFRLNGDHIPSWSALAERLIPYVVEMAFTHIELMPIAEYPFGGSWGYQPLGLFAPSSRFGPPERFADFVDACHGAGIGVIVDWVPSHFPKDIHGLGSFDGTALYEYADPREGIHLEWNTYVYNFGRREVQGFLIANAIHWLEHFHVDGLRVCSVDSMLYRDYGRKDGEWIPNIYGGRENFEAIGFLQHLNLVVDERCVGAVMIADPAPVWPDTTRPVAEGGLGFDYQWATELVRNTLDYMRLDQIERQSRHEELANRLRYFNSEKHLFPLSHDEVAHGAGSLLQKMAGDDWQRFANLRAFLGLIWSHPGKKLMFMGGEFAQLREWNHDSEIDWDLLDHSPHRGVQRLVRDLNTVYRQEVALHENDAPPTGFRWIENETASLVFALVRNNSTNRSVVLSVSNMAAVPLPNYRIGVPVAGRWNLLLNTDSASYGGSDMLKTDGIETDPVFSNGERQSISFLLPSLTTLLFRLSLPCI